MLAASSSDDSVRAGYLGVAQLATASTANRSASVRPAIALRATVLMEWIEGDMIHAWSGSIRTGRGTASRWRPTRRSRAKGDRRARRAAPRSADIVGISLSDDMTPNIFG